ncbi:MAG: FtsL-like putative cell division protein, partial [Bacteroidales bacterium]
IFGGQILVSSGFLQNIGFVLFIFALIVLNITINFGIERSLLTERKNQRELKHLKSDYVSKMATLQFNSKKTEIEKKLKELKSTIKPPIDPPIRVVIEN